MRASQSDLSFTYGGSTNTAIFTAAAGVVFTAARVFALRDGGRTIAFKNHDGDGNLTIASQVITWAPSAANSRLLAQDSSYRLDLKVGGVWVNAAFGTLDGEGGNMVTGSATGAVNTGTGVSSSAYSPMALLTTRTYPMLGYRHNANAAIVPGANKALLSPVIFDQDVSVARIGFSVGATVASGKAHLALYAADPTTLWPTGAPLVSSNAEITAATAGNNAQTTFTTPAAVLKEKIYWVALAGSLAGVGYNPADCDVWQKVGNASLGSLAASGKIGQSYSIAQTYGTTMTWADNAGGDISNSGTRFSDAPLLFFQKA